MESVAVDKWEREGMGEVVTYSGFTAGMLAIELKKRSMKEAP